jgi:hypothetical protein
VLLEVLLGGPDALVDDGTAALEGDRTRRLQHEGQRLRRPQQVKSDFAQTSSSAPSPPATKA